MLLKKHQHNSQQQLGLWILQVLRSIGVLILYMELYGSCLVVYGHSMRVCSSYMRVYMSTVV